MREKLVTLVVCVIAAVAVALTANVPVAAQRMSRGRLELLREFALDISRVAANEYTKHDDRGLWNGSVPSEILLIVQVTESHGSRIRTRMNWLRRHSCRVLSHPDGDCRKTCEGGNCVWSRNLEWGDDKPEGWPDPYPWRPEPWERTRRLVLAALMGRVTYRPCLGRPMTWGSRRLDYDEAVSRGQIPLSCSTPRDGNVGFTWTLRRGDRPDPNAPLPVELAVPAS